MSYTGFDLDEEAWEDSGEEGEEEGDTVSEAQLEKLLLENMSDDELGPEGEGDKDDVREGETKKRKKAGFASRVCSKSSITIVVWSVL